MRTLLGKSLAAIVAIASLVVAQKEAAKPDDVAMASEQTYAKLKGNRAGEEREFEVAPGVKMTFCWCPAGEFSMGSPLNEEGRDSRDEDQVKVTLTKGFWISRTEVTQSQWAAVMGSNPLDGMGPYGKPHPESTKGPNRPIVGVSWEDAQVFMQKINATLGTEDGGKMSLPTEAQYEYAARAGEPGRYPGGSLDEVAWFEENSGGYTKPVGTKKSNAWGLYDMNGNAWEWVQDCYSVELPGGTDPISKEISLDRVIRGGCWIKDAANCRLATRSYRAQMASQCFSIGIRIVRNSLPVGTSTPAISPLVDSRNESKIQLQMTAEVDQRVPIDLSQMKIQSREAPPKDITNSLGMKLVWIPKGTFRIGSPESEEGRSKDESQCEVTISTDYYLGAYEVTQTQYQTVTGNNPSCYQGALVGNENADLPVENISWDDAVEFCKKLSELPDERKAGRVYHLPTEAQWEYACRAGSKTTYSFDDEEGLLPEYGWFKRNSSQRTHTVGLLEPNAWGLYDMHGNVWEWCSDWYGEYTNGAVSDPTGPTMGSDRVNRGGCWLYRAANCRSASRNWAKPSYRDGLLGFRVALNPVGNAESPEATSKRTADKIDTVGTDTGDATTDGN